MQPGVIRPVAISSGSVPGMPADQEPPSYEVLAALVVSLRGELARAQERITELEDRLRTTSRNSSMPPSGEGLAKPPPRSRSLRKKTGRRPGGQDGHPGTTLAQVAKPDREVRHEPGSCSGCGGGLAGRPVTGVERRQVFDLPPVTVKVTEHQLIERECGCGHRTRGAAPEGAQAPVQYGPRVAAVIVYLYIGQFLSRKRTAQALAELFGIPLSPGTVAGITARAAGKLDGFLERVRENITASDVAGFDETGFRVEGRLHWVHCARTGKYTLLMCTPGAAGRRWRRWGSCRLSPGSPSMTPGPRMTPTPLLVTNCAALTPCGSSRPSPTARPRADGAGLPRPPMRSPECRR